MTVTETVCLDTHTQFQNLEKIMFSTNNKTDILLSRGVKKDSVEGGKYFECGARSAPKFFLPPLEFFLPPPRKIS